MSAPDSDSRVTDEMVEAGAEIEVQWDGRGELAILGRADRNRYRDRFRAALTAALAARPEQEPVAWEYHTENFGWIGLPNKSFAEEAIQSGHNVRALYAAPLAQPGREELVEALKPFAAIANFYADNHPSDDHPLYADMPNNLDDTDFTLGDCRRARRLIGGTDD